MGRPDSLARAALQGQGQAGGTSSQGNQSSRIVYPAIVVKDEDPLGMKRIVARIISLDETGRVNGGRDRDTPDEQLPFCVPFIQNHVHIMPLVDEMVYIILENPNDNSAPRYYMGPQTNSQFKLKFQDYKEANQVFKYTDFNLNQNKSGNEEAATVLPKAGDIALQGRTDADLILRPREVFLVAGKFVKGTLNVNKESPSNLQLIQKENDDGDDELIPSYSQANLVSTNINLFSPRGKFRDTNISEFEKNEDLKSFIEIADSLHPAVFGDELVKLLDLIVKVMLNHIHTPQMPLVPFPESEELSAYTVEGELQNIISNHIRVN